MTIEELIKPGLESIQTRADEIDALLSEMEEIPDEIANTIKNTVQSEAYREWHKWNNSWGLIAAATGVGKSRIALIAASWIVEQKPNARILICVPTERLRDKNWEEEFRKWKMIRVYNKNVTRVCHVSMSKIEKETYDMVIFDEAHNITEMNSTFFKKNTIHTAMCLTATPSSDPLKKLLLTECGFKTVYSLSLDIAVKLRLVSPYEITIIETRLESSKKTVPGGSKEKPFLNTELNQYNYLTNTVNKLMFNKSKTPKEQAVVQFRVIARMHFIYNLQSKMEAAENVIRNLPKDERTLIFCSNIAQAEKLCSDTYHSQTDDTALKSFMKGDINTLSCVQSLNEGHNIPVKVDNAVVVQINSSDRTLVQRIGRVLRYKKGHVAKIILIVCVETVDENWLFKAIAGLDESKITRVRYKNLELLTTNPI